MATGMDTESGEVWELQCNLPQLRCISTCPHCECILLSILLLLRKRVIKQGLGNSSALLSAPLAQLQYISFVDYF